jgi:hypothetical protein
VEPRRMCLPIPPQSAACHPSLYASTLYSTIEASDRYGSSSVYQQFITQPATHDHDRTLRLGSVVGFSFQVQWIVHSPLEIGYAIMGICVAACSTAYGRAESERCSVLRPLRQPLSLASLRSRPSVRLERVNAACLNRLYPAQTRRKAKGDLAIADFPRDLSR